MQLLGTLSSNEKGLNNWSEWTASIGAEALESVI